jgi:hypothetical protein
MATKTFTIDTNEWLYPDVFGVTHAVTNAQTFTIELTDGGASAVSYQTNQGQSVTTTDGYSIPIFARTENASGTAGNDRRKWGPTADAQDGVTLYSLAGEFTTRCPLTGIQQNWKPAKVNVDNIDAPTAITATFEDQYENEFTWTAVTIS